MTSNQIIRTKVGPKNEELLDEKQASRIVDFAERKIAAHGHFGIRIMFLRARAHLQTNKKK